MTFKSETQSLLRSFFSWVKTQFNRGVKILRSDNGAEFLSMESYFNEHGIIFHHTCPYTPQQNGVVERKHRHLLNVARALRFQANLPLKYWGESIQTACYLINRLPTPLLSLKTPYELLHGTPPSYSHIRTFGCLCYATNLNPKHKFDARAKQCIFIGYPLGQKGYKVLCLETRRIFTSRDVLFHETTFPFSHEPLEIQDDQIVLPNPSIHNPSTEPDLPTLTHHTEPPPLTPTPQAMDTPSQDHLTNGNTQPILQETIDTPLSSPNNTTPTPSPPPPPPPPPPLRRSNRLTKPPSSLQDFHYYHPTLLDPGPISSSTTLSTRHPIQRYVSYSQLSTSHKKFVHNISHLVEPTSYEQACTDAKWVAAMKSEIDALETNHTWTMVPLPAGHHAIGCKWIYKIKYQSDGSIERYKARLVAKGFTQREGIDYKETFAPVAKLVTVRCLLTVAAVRNWNLHQMDVQNAFLHGELLEEVYMQPPPGFRRQGENLVCRLHKSLYGLKQASRSWFQKFSSSVANMGFQQSKADYSLFIKVDSTSYTAILLYVDDMIITGNDEDTIHNLKQFLNSCFKIKDLGPLKYFLGIEVARAKTGITICQRKYTLDLLEEVGLLGAKPTRFPMEQTLKLNLEDGEALHDPTHYRRLVGKLIYLTITRPEITFAVNTLSQFMQLPRKPHLDAVFRLLRYLKGAPGQGLIFPSSGSLKLTGYCDAD
jgi:hypothetical protein